MPLPKVRAQGETEVLKVIKTGKRQKKAWKRMVTKVCFVGDGFTRKPPKYERFIRPMVRSHYSLTWNVLYIIWRSALELICNTVSLRAFRFNVKVQSGIFSSSASVLNDLLLLILLQGLRFKKAHVTHPELKATFCLPILGVKKNPSSPLYTSLGVITKGTVIEVNVSELGLVTQGGKVIWGECSSLCESINPLFNVQYLYAVQ